MKTNDEYWARRDRPELAAGMEERISRFYEVVESSGRLELWERAENTYYGHDADGGYKRSAAVTFGGEQGEAVGLRINHYRSNIRSILNITTGTRPAFEAKSLTNDYRSAQERKLAESIIEYHLAEGDHEDRLIKAAEYAIVRGEGWILQTWDEKGGETVDMDQVPASREDEEALATYQAELDAWQAMVAEMGDTDDIPDPPTEPEVEMVDRIHHEGAPCITVLQPEDVVRDVTAEGLAARWFIVRRRLARYDLAAIYPGHREVILDSHEDEKWTEIGLSRRYEQETYDSDEVTVWELFHLSGDALPGGRHAIMVGGEIIADGPLTYTTLPVHPMMPTTDGNEPFGWADSFDMLGPQQAYDAAISTVLTNHEALGTQKVWVRTGSSVDIHSDLGGSGVLVMQSEEPPIGLKLLESQNASMDLANTLKEEIGGISGINSVARGEPQASLKSGSALALVHSMAIQNNSGIQRAYARLWEKVASSLVELYRDFATTERVVEIVGSGSRTAARRFTGGDLKNIKRVAIDLGNPVMRTAAGRKEMADKLLQMQAITPQQFLEVLSTGRLDAVTQRPEAHRTLINDENNRLMQGEEVIVLKTDMHGQHVQEHLAVLDDPDVRRDDAIVQRVTAHIEAHVHWAQTIQMQEPSLMELSGQPQLGSVAQMQQAQQAMGNQPTPPPPGTAPAAGGDMGQQAQVPGVSGAAPDISGLAADLPKMPNLPEEAAGIVQQQSNGSV